MTKGMSSGSERDGVAEEWVSGESRRMDGREGGRSGGLGRWWWWSLRLTKAALGTARNGKSWIRRGALELLELIPLLLPPHPAYEITTPDTLLQSRPRHGTIQSNKRLFTSDLIRPYEVAPPASPHNFHPHHPSSSRCRSSTTLPLRSQSDLRHHAPRSRHLRLPRRRAHAHPWRS